MMLLVGRHVSHGVMLHLFRQLSHIYCPPCTAAAFMLALLSKSAIYFSSAAPDPMKMARGGAKLVALVCIVAIMTSPTAGDDVQLFVGALSPTYLRVRADACFSSEDMRLHAAVT
jgi:hypothetical protein